jgi:hypothetical protein
MEAKIEESMQQSMLSSKNQNSLDSPSKLPGVQKKTGNQLTPD